MRFHRCVFIQIWFITWTCAGMVAVWQTAADRQYCYKKREVKMNFSVPGPENPVVTLCTTRFNTEKLVLFPCSVFMCFVWVSEQTAIISLYSINWLVCITETESVYCAVRAGSLYMIQVMCFVWIWEQTGIISLYSINWLVCITETESVYCAVRTGSVSVIRIYVCP